MKTAVYRVIDANFNRVKEGLRVCEEFLRFFCGDKKLTGDFKKMRSRISAIYNNFADHKDLFILARDTETDVGKKGFLFERAKDRPLDVFRANLNRSKEGLRVLEEFSKLVDKPRSDDFRRLRYGLYEIEKRALLKLQGLSKKRL